MQYSKPFLITYLNTATFSFYLLPTLFKKLRQEKSNESTKWEFTYMFVNNTKLIRYLLDY